MNRYYVIYLCTKESCDVEFSSPYNSFNSAKNNIDNFLKELANKRGKPINMVSKEEFEKIKLLKKPDDCLYVRRKNSEAVIYSLLVDQGRFYNSYSIEKYGKIGISEFLAHEGRTTINEDKIKDLHVTNYERGAHVSFVSELKNVLTNRESSQKKVTFELNKDVTKDNKFVDSLIVGKTKLKNVTPPTNKKNIINL